MPRISVDKWNNHKAAIERLYLAEDKTLKDVMDTMETSHNFQATYVKEHKLSSESLTDVLSSKSQYERQFKSWKFRKNLKNED